MAALDKNGMYQEAQNGELLFIESNNDVTTFSDDEKVVNDIIWTMMNLNVNGIEFNQNINNLITIISELLKTSDVVIDKQYILNKFNSPDKLNFIIDRLKFELLSKTSLENASRDISKGMQNYILETMIKLYRDPRTLMATTNPTTMEPVHDAVHFVGKGKELRSHFDPYTHIYVNQTTAVGKKDIGISAVAQKAFYALNYYNFVRQSQGKSIFDLFYLEVPEEWGGVIQSLGFPDTKIDLNSLVHLYNHLQLINNNADSGSVALNGILFDYRQDENGIPVIQYHTKNGLKMLQVGDRLGDFTLTTLNSAIISSSTDNAKEMMMDLLNATPEVLPAYEFLMSIGVDLRQAAKILTDPIVNALITVKRGNLFANQKGYSRMENLFTKKAQPEILRVLNTMGIQYDENKMNILEAIFKGAKELTILGQSLGINGGIKVEFGEPLLFQLNFERNVREVLGKSFNLEKFLSDYIPYDDEINLIEGSYAHSAIELYEQNKTRYNLLDIIYQVPHFHSMFTVPLQYKNCMQLLSKDIDNVHHIASAQAYKVWWNQDGLRQLLRAVNDRKIADFFIKYPFEYDWDYVYDGTRLIAGNTSKLRTNNLNGLLTLKTYIEKEIISILKTDENYMNNEFVLNLIPASSIHPLMKEKFNFYGSKISLTDPQNEDRIHIIKQSFDMIKDDDIKGHSILEWMFVYDLLVNKHSLSGNSMPVLFSNGVNFKTKNIITQWIEYLNSYDSSTGYYDSKAMPFNNLPIHTKKTTEDYHDPDFPEDNFRSNRSFYWLYDPNYLPLFIRNNKAIEDVLVDRDSLYAAFKQGLLRINKC